TTGEDGFVKCWSFPEYRLKWERRYGPDAVVHIAISANSNQLLASGGASSDGSQNDRTMQLIDLDTGELLHNINGQEHPVRAVGFTSDMAQVVSVDDQLLRFWDASSGRPLNYFDAGQLGLYDIRSIAYI